MHILKYTWSSVTVISISIITISEEILMLCAERYGKCHSKLSVHLSVLVWPCLPTHRRCKRLLFSTKYELSCRRRDFFFRTCDTGKRTALDPRLRPRGQRVRAVWMCSEGNLQSLSFDGLVMPIGNEYQRSIRQEEKIKRRLHSEILESVEVPRHVCLNKKFSVACGTIYSCLPLVLVGETTERSHFNPRRIITGCRAGGGVQGVRRGGRAHMRPEIWCTVPVYLNNANTHMLWSLHGTKKQL
jgi:hypothetical protein